MRLLKQIAKSLLFFLGVFLIIVVVFIASDWSYYKRLLTFDREKMMTNVEWYQPSVQISAGNPPELLLADSQNTSISSKALDSIISFAEETDSMSLLIWHRGFLQLEWYGEGYDRTSYMESASMHKSVLALLFGIAIDEGFISSVDEYASKYLNEWQGDDRSKITIKNMLQMAHGLERASGGFSPLGNNMKLMMGTDWAEIALKSKAIDPPNSVFAYSNLNAQLLGLILERASGMKYAEFLERFLWSKIAESNAWVWLDSEGGLAKTSGSLFTPARNWLRLGLLHLNQGLQGEEQIVSESWISQVRTPSKNNPNYGYQTWLGNVFNEKRSYGKGVNAYVPHSEPFRINGIVYFDGSGGQRVYIVSSEDLVIVRTGEGGIDFKTGAFQWDEPKLPNMVIDGICRNYLKSGKLLGTDCDNDS